MTKYTEHPSCWFCRQTRSTEKICVNAFVSDFEEDEFRAAYKAGSMLCMMHLRWSEAAKDRFTGKIERATVAKYKELITLLDEIKKKNNYRFSEGKWSEGARDAWKRAVAVINNQCGTRQV